MSETINLGPEIDAVCAKLGLADKSYVSEIVFQPSHVSVTVLRGKDGPYSGSKYIDQETGEIAKDVLEFKVTT